MTPRTKDKYQNLKSWPRGYKTYFMLNSAMHEIYPAHKCNNCWHFQIIRMINTTSERLKGRNYCVAAVERLPALHCSVDFIFLSFESRVSLWNFETIRGSLMKPKWQKLASLAQEIFTL